MTKSDADLPRDGAEAKAKKRANDLLDREAAVLEYEAGRRSAQSNMERLRDLRLVHEAAAKSAARLKAKAAPVKKRKPAKPSA